MSLTDNKLDNTYNSGWDSYPELSFHAAGLRAVAEAAVKDAVGGEAVAILNCGEIGPTGEQDEFEIDCEYGALERFTSQHPGKKFKLYTRPQASAAVPEAMSGDSFDSYDTGWNDCRAAMIAMLAASQPDISCSQNPQQANASTGRVKESSNREHASAAVPEDWREVMQGLVECARDELVRCEGMKCREPNCISCNDEQEALSSIERSREFTSRARALLASKGDA